jgi:hypothetical protein
LGNFQANTITATLAGQATSAITAATVTAGTQSAITSVGTLTSLAVTGNVSAGNVTTATGTITAATGQFTNINNSLQTINANVGAFHTYANTALGSLATGANANTAAYLTTATGNISAGNVTVTNLVTAKNYSGQVRNLGTITAGAGTEITIDFATDHIVRFNYTTEPVQVAFTNYSAGKTVTLIAVNTNAANRQLEIGIAAGNAQGAATLDINGVTTGIVTYYCVGTTVNDVYASTVYVI